MSAQNMSQEGDERVRRTEVTGRISAVFMGVVFLVGLFGPAHALDGEVAIDAIDPETRCAVGFGKKCGVQKAVDRGMLATDTEPLFGEGLYCRTIDDTWAMDYTFKRKHTAYHGGIDMPAPFGTPILAAADGVVVGKFPADNGQRGIELVLRHRPADTGLPFWVYTQYAHFDKMPDWQLGQRVEKGQVLGPTGNSGTNSFTGQQNSKRRPAIHFSVIYSTRPDYALTDRAVVPADGHWMDPVAFYRPAGPYESAAVKALSDAEKQVPVAVKLDDGQILPESAKRIWPYACSYQRLVLSPRNTDQKANKRSKSKKQSSSGSCRDGNADACREKCNGGSKGACKRLKALTN